MLQARRPLGAVDFVIYWVPLLIYPANRAGTVAKRIHHSLSRADYIIVVLNCLHFNLPSKHVAKLKSKRHSLTLQDLRLTWFLRGTGKRHRLNTNTFSAQHIQHKLARAVVPIFQCLAFCKTDVIQIFFKEV